MLKQLIERIIEEQSDKYTLLVGQFHFPVDISLTNGNILLRAFRIIELKGEEVKGITLKEEYSAPRENRAPVYTYIELDEIESLDCFELDISYSRKMFA